MCRYYGCLLGELIDVCVRVCAGLSVVLDLTPNYLGTNVWFEPDNQADVLNKLNVTYTHTHSHTHTPRTHTQTYNTHTHTHTCIQLSDLE